MTKTTIKAVYELKPDRYSPNKSFYGKANVIELSNGVKLLQSYDTIVAGINTSGRFVRLWGGWSATTAKHLASFSDGYRGKKAWEEMPVDKAFCNRYGAFRTNAKYTATYY